MPSAGTETIGRSYNCTAEELWEVCQAVESYAETLGITKLEIANGF